MTDEFTANQRLFNERGARLEDYRQTVTKLEARVAELETRVVAMKTERDGAIAMLAAWCVAVDKNGAGWDDWDEHYKDAMYREGPLRSLLDAAIATEKSLYE